MKNLNKIYKNRLLELAGIIKKRDNKNILNEDIELKATTGRSDEGTLSFYIEEYLLNLGANILTNLDNLINNTEYLKLVLKKSETRIISNSLILKLFVQDKEGQNKINEEIMLTISVNLESNSNTTTSIKYKNINNKLNLTSKHSLNDLTTYITDVCENILNSVYLNLQKTNPIQLT
jgi:hypothetical protein